MTTTSVPADEVSIRSSRAAVQETHCAVVFLFGERAYKVKKQVDLGFLDFRTVAERERHRRGSQARRPGPIGGGNTREASRSCGSATSESPQAESPPTAKACRVNRTGTPPRSCVRTRRCSSCRR